MHERCETSVLVERIARLAGLNEAVVSSLDSRGGAQVLVGSQVNLVDLRHQAMQVRFKRVRPFDMPDARYFCGVLLRELLDRDDAMSAIEMGTGIAVLRAAGSISHA